MNQSVASITIAYNAARVLPRQLEALLFQTQPLQEIIVVDNASTDGTSAMLSARYPQVTVLKMPTNLGAAGAWAAGLSYAALQKRHDWVWSFDADSVPSLDCLGKMLTILTSPDCPPAEIGMVAPMPVHQATRTRYPPLFWRDGFVKPSPEQMRERVWFADAVIVSGSLTRRELIEKIGLPRADFFMDFFDFEYSMRATAHGYKIAVVPQAELGHEIGDARMVRFPGRPRLWTNQPPYREYYFSRNLAYLAWWLYPNRSTKSYVTRFLAVRGIQVLLFSSKKLSCITRMIQGFHDGRRGKLGIRLQPVPTKHSVGSVNPQSA
jgi:rhamnopyranosyl-N-acetylglucosaminyl-diphospho-decaprenol beta-1,3/1,4-galactofuranosyltransferase